MKQTRVDERILSLLSMEQDSSPDAVFDAVKALWDDRNDANTVAGDLTQAMVEIEVELAVPPNTGTSAEHILEKIQGLKDHSALGVENGRRVREAAGLDPHAPADRLLAEVAAARDERRTLRQMLSLAPDAQSVVVFDTVDRLSRRARVHEELAELREAVGISVNAPMSAIVLRARVLTDGLREIRDEVGLNEDSRPEHVVTAIQSMRATFERFAEMERELAQCRTDFAKVAIEVSAQPTLASVLVAVEKLRNPPKQREAAMSNAAWLAEAWSTLCEALDLPPGAPLGDALEVIGEARRGSEQLVRANAQLYDLNGFAEAVCYALGLSSGATIEKVGEEIRELRESSNDAVREQASVELFVERASAVREAIALLTSADARLALSIDEATR